MPSYFLSSHSRDAFLVWLVAVGATCLVAGCGPARSREPDLPKQPDRWVNSVVLDADSKVNYVGKTKELLITQVSSQDSVSGLRSVRVGDVVNGVQIGAIQCSFHWRDAESSGRQYMWRGRWACMAGRSRDEVQTAVADDGTKRHDYIHIVPVGLRGE